MEDFHDACDSIKTLSNRYYHAAKTNVPCFTKNVEIEKPTPSNGTKCLVPLAIIDEN